MSRLVETALVNVSRIDNFWKIIVAHFDILSNCQVLARTSCYLKDVGAECGRSCGLCGGLTPAASVTCYDAYQNCGQLAKTACSQKAVAAKCVKSCGNCKSAVVTTTKTTVNSILYS